MAYSLENRFGRPQKFYPLLDPGQYGTISDWKHKQNLAPFLTKSPRVSQQGNKIWTHATYNASCDHRIPNCTSMMSKVPRFKYEAVRNEELDKIICQCGEEENKCECFSNKEEPNVKRKEPIRPRIFIGRYPRPMSDGGISAPCGRDRGFKCFPDGTQKRLLEGYKDGPSIYNTEKREFTKIYHGCKWSHWTSRKSAKRLDISPGPADYTIEPEPTESAKCAEKFRAERRKKSKQYRFIEMVQQRNLRDNLPGPSTYSPKIPKGTEMQFLGSKAERFKTSKYEVIPGPSDYIIKRTFDLPEQPNKNCHATLPTRAPFGSKAPRLKPISHGGPGPADYETTRKLCQIIVCSKAPFGSFTRRFPETKEPDESVDEENEVNYEGEHKKCLYSNLNWMFKSRTKRLTPLKKKLFEPSPADLPMKNLDVKRSLQLQKAAPFYESAERFQPWYNWVPIYNLDPTPGPAQYRLEQPSIPAVVRGPLFRSKRFKDSISHSPPCNHYKVRGGVETVLYTNNVRLKQNTSKKHKFSWTALKQKSKLSDKEKESLLLNNCIAMLNVDLFTDTISSAGKNYSQLPVQRKKLLHCFLYQQTIPTYF